MNCLDRKTSIIIRLIILNCCSIKAKMSQADIVKSPKKSSEEYKEIIDRITSSDSPVGIDAIYTHAVIIEYLQQITKRLERLESMMVTDKNPEERCRLWKPGKSFFTKIFFSLITPSKV